LSDDDYHYVWKPHEEWVQEQVLLTRLDDGQVPCWVAECGHRQGCSAFGATVEDALEMLAVLRLNYDEDFAKEPT
jgi:predicted RNase H-like HicB family nuclease